MYDGVSYNEDYGMFMFKRKILGLFYIDDTIVYERNISINEDNRLRKLANITVLTESDIDLLYQFAVKEFNYKGNRYDFEDMPLKNIFIGLDNFNNFNNLTMDKLIVLAYDYLKHRKVVIIEKFEGSFNGGIMNKNYVILLLCILWVIFVLYYL